MGSQQEQPVENANDKGEGILKDNDGATFSENSIPTTEN